MGNNNFTENNDGTHTDTFGNFLGVIKIAGLAAAGAAVGTVIALSLLGFTAGGIAAGSAAAGLHAAIGNVAAGSLFAFCQSAAAGGAAAGVVSTVGIAGGASAVGAMVASRARRVNLNECAERVVRAAMARRRVIVDSRLIMQERSMSLD